MAHFAQLNSNNEVIQVIVVNNSELIESNVENESKGIKFCQSIFGANTYWVQTSYNGNFRKRFAQIGGVYDPVRDAFIRPKPFDSWILNEDNCDWESPVPRPEEPEDAKPYFWSELNQCWEIFEDYEIE